MAGGFGVCPTPTPQVVLNESESAPKFVAVTPPPEQQKQSFMSIYTNNNTTEEEETFLKKSVYQNKEFQAKRI